MIYEVKLEVSVLTLLNSESVTSLKITIELGGNWIYAWFPHKVFNDIVKINKLNYDWIVVLQFTLCENRWSFVLSCMS